MSFRIDGSADDRVWWMPLNNAFRAMNWAAESHILNEIWGETGGDAGTMAAMRRARNAIDREMTAILHRGGR